jgi:hypothetical protein
LTTARFLLPVDGEREVHVKAASEIDWREVKAVTTAAANLLTLKTTLDAKAGSQKDALTVTESFAKAMDQLRALTGQG